MNQLGGGQKCASCHKTVYHVEKVQSIGKTFHKACLKCTECKQTLNSNRVYDHKSEPYCKSCYDKTLGPKGYGYGVGSGTLQPHQNMHEAMQALANKPTTTHKASVAKPSAPVKKFALGGGDKCSQCKKSVYAAERVDSDGLAFHKRCFRCASCSKGLEKGKTFNHGSEIHCAQCYKVQHGPTGYGVGVLRDNGKVPVNSVQS